MAFKMRPPGKMKSAFRKSTIIKKFGSKKNLGRIDTDVDADAPNTFYYNSNMGPMKLLNPSALKQMEEEMVDPNEEMDENVEEEVTGAGEEVNIGLLPSEHPDTSVYDGTDINERIFDYEDRIEFLQEDIFNADEATEQQKKDLKVLKAELNELYEEKGM